MVKILESFKDLGMLLQLLSWHWMLHSNDVLILVKNTVGKNHNFLPQDTLPSISRPIHQPTPLQKSIKPTSVHSQNKPVLMSASKGSFVCTPNGMFFVCWDRTVLQKEQLTENEK